MDHEPSGGSPSSSSGGSSQRKARKRPWDDSDEDPPSLGSETSSRSRARSDSSESGASLDRASTSNVLSLPVERCKTICEDDCADSDSSAEGFPFAGSAAVAVATNTVWSGAAPSVSATPAHSAPEGTGVMDTGEAAATPILAPPPVPSVALPAVAAQAKSSCKGAESSEPDQSATLKSSDDDMDVTPYLTASQRKERGGASKPQDSESSTEDSVARRKPRSKDEEQAGPLSLSTMKNLYGHFTGATLDFRMPCTATEGTPCQIVRHLSVWNEFLCLACWQLREMPGTSGKLSLTLFREPSCMYSSPQQLHLATLLACQLLKTHHCMAHVELDIYLFESHHEILSDALRVSPFITSVKLTFRGLISGDYLATAALSLPHLQELEYTGNAQHSATLLARLSTFLQTTSSLTALRVSMDCPKGLSSEDIFKALGQNCSLKELVLPSRLIAEAPPSAQAVFTEWLTNSASLTSLSVVGEWGSCALLKGILGALLRNRSIVAVDFKCPEDDQADIQLLSKIFEQNKILRSFKISYKLDWHSKITSFVQGCPDKADCDRCLKALLENHSLEEVALPINVWDEHQWKELFEALPTKTNLKRVSIETLGRAPAPLLAKLCAALTETGADEKVSFNSCFPDEVFDSSFTDEEFDKRCACKAFSSVLVEVRAVFHGALERMASLGHITSLHLDFDSDIEYELDGVLSSALATFLGATRTLKTLTLSTSWYVMLYDCQEALMDGLAANTSLRELRINVYDTGNDFSVFSEPLADIINASRNISRVHFKVDCGECAFLRRLSAGIRDNYTLLSVTSGWGPYRQLRAWFEVWDVTTRNCGLLTGAADFARGARHDRHCALALERIHGHPELVEEVARLEKVDQPRAAAMVRDGLRSIEGMHAFMRLAGVVKESVSCHACRDGRTQLDSLNEDCWRAIMRYLKLRDVTEPCAVVPAQ